MTLLVIDLQARLLPAIDAAEPLLANARRLIAGAGLLGVPLIATEQNPDGLGPTPPGLLPPGTEILPKMSFDALAEPWIAAALPPGPVTVIGCEAHVCVLQTVLSLTARGPVAVVADAVGSRTAANRAAALSRMGQAGAEVVTTEMVLFEWLGRADHPAFRQVLALIR